MRPASLIAAAIIALATTTVVPVFAQDTECGTVLPEAQIHYELQRIVSRVERTEVVWDDPYIIPVAPHIVRRSDGSGGFTSEQWEAALYAANVHYQAVGLGLYQYSAIDYIDDDEYFYHMDNSLNWTTLRETNVVPEAVNLYFVPESDTSNFGYCGLSSFSGSAVQGIIMNNSCADTASNRSTMAHEIGHYFDLYHTHETAFDEECPDGYNCSWAGDLICDTEADPGLYDSDAESYWVTDYPDCEYIPHTPPPPFCDATPYDPPTENLMSYSRKLCRWEFTQGQEYWMRDAIVYARQDLAYSYGGILVLPTSLDTIYVPLGTLFDSTMQITYVLYDTIDILSATSATGLISLSGSLPAMIGHNDTLELSISSDVVLTGSACDLGMYVDTLLFITSHPEVPSITLPVALSAVYSEPGPAASTFTNGCLALTLPNTVGIGDQQDSALILGNENVMSDGSLILGVVDGSDTTIYADVFDRSDFVAVDGYAAGVDSTGRISQTIRFATSDLRLHGEVTYRYGWSSVVSDSCNYVTIDYKIENPCETTLTVIAGVLADFDLDIYSENNGLPLDDHQLAVVNTSSDSKACGLALIYTCGEGAGVNVERSYLLSSMQDNHIYRLLSEPSGLPFFSNDVAALVSFGKVTLEPDASTEFRAALLYSSISWGALPQFAEQVRALDRSVPGDIDGDCVADTLDNCPYDYNPDQSDANGNDIGDVCDLVCGDADRNFIVNISDAVYLIAYIFGGGPAPDPLLVGDCDCNEIVNISDAVYLIAYIFGGGPDPCAACP